MFIRVENFIGRKRTSVDTQCYRDLIVLTARLIQCKDVDSAQIAHYCHIQKVKTKTTQNHDVTFNTRRNTWSDDNTDRGTLSSASKHRKGKKTKTFFGLKLGKYLATI